MVQLGGQLLSASVYFAIFTLDARPGVGGGTGEGAGHKTGL